MLKALWTIALVAAFSSAALAAGPKAKPVSPEMKAAIAEAKTAYNEKAPVAVSGYVFVDANKNGKQDAGEKGLAGVGVTDGALFAETGKDGAYRLTISPDPTTPWRPARCVAVTWPSNYWPTKRWWYRLSEIPDGKNVNFALRPDEQKLPFAFSHITDNHSAGGGYATYVKDFKRLGGLSKFVVDTGDFLYANYSQPPAALLTYKQYAKNIENANFPAPLFFVPGNHDVTGTRVDPKLYDPKHPLFCNGVYTKFLGPVRWSFNYAGVHFVGVDWKSPQLDKTGMWSSFTPQVAVDWMKRDFARLEKGTRSFMFVHFPTGVPEFYRVIQQNVTHGFGGHGHRTMLYPYGCPTITCVNLRGNGPSVLGIVTKDDFGIVARCPGCKGNRDYHSRLCALRHLTHRVIPKLKGLRGKPATLENKRLGKAEVAAAGGDAIEIDAIIQLGASKKARLNVGGLEISYDGKFLNAGGIPIPFEPWPGQKDKLMLHLAASKDFFALYANNLIRIYKPFNVGDVSKVTFTAADATLEKAIVWPLKNASPVLKKLGYHR